MIAAGPFAWRRFGGNALDVPVAALAGLSVAFVAFAAPSDLLGELIGSTGLPSLLPAAEPPLGMKARIGLGGAGAVLVFALAFLLLRWLDRRGRRPEAEDEEDIAIQPRLRRRDFHPDAPSCRPISAARDFGEPEPLIPADAPEFEPEPLAWTPEPLARAPEPELEPFAWAPEFEPPSNVPEPEPEPLAWSPEPEPLSPKPAPEPAAGPAPTPEPQSASIADLMARLEQGLARRRAPLVAPEPLAAEPSAAEPEAAEPEMAEPPPVPQVFPEASDDRLQSAIENLQRLAQTRD